MVNIKSVKALARELNVKAQDTGVNASLVYDDESQIIHVIGNGKKSDACVFYTTVEKMSLAGCRALLVGKMIEVG